MDQFREETNEQLGELKDDVRRAYFLIEGLHDKVGLVATEGVASVREQLTERQEEISKKLGEVETFNRDLLQGWSGGVMHMLDFPSHPVKPSLPDLMRHL